MPLNFFSHLHPQESQKNHLETYEIFKGQFYVCFVGHRSQKVWDLGGGGGREMGRAVLCQLIVCASPTQKKLILCLSHRRSSPLPTCFPLPGSHLLQPIQIFSLSLKTLPLHSWIGGGLVCVFSSSPICVQALCSSCLGAAHREEVPIVAATIQLS